MRETQNYLYNYRLLQWQMARLNKTPEQLAAESGLSTFSVQIALAGGLGTLKKLRRLADALQVDWNFITQTDLPESRFRRAVLGSSRSVNGGRSVGGSASAR